MAALTNNKHTLAHTTHTTRHALHAHSRTHSHTPENNEMDGQTQAKRQKLSLRSIQMQCRAAGRDEGSGFQASKPSKPYHLTRNQASRSICQIPLLASLSMSLYAPATRVWRVCGGGEEEEADEERDRKREKNKFNCILQHPSCCSAAKVSGGSRRRRGLSSRLPSYHLRSASCTAHHCCHCASLHLTSRTPRQSRHPVQFTEVCSKPSPCQYDGGR